MITTDLEANAESAVITWLENSGSHGITWSVPVRRYEQAKYDPDTGDLDPLTLPAIVVRATAERQLHPRVQVFLMTVEATLNAIGDDTDKSTWDAAVAALYQILIQYDDLAGALTSSDFIAGGIVERIPGSKSIEDRHWKQTFRLTLYGSLE